MRSSYMHHLPAGLKGIINSTKDGVSEVEFRVRGSDGFADVIIMRVPDVKLEHVLLLLSPDRRQPLSHFLYIEIMDFFQTGKNFAKG